MIEKRKWESYSSFVDDILTIIGDAGFFSSRGAIIATMKNFTADNKKLKSSAIYSALFYIKQELFLLLAKDDLVFLKFSFHIVNTIGDVINIKNERVEWIHLQFELEFI